MALPLPPSFNEADVSDKPAAIRRRPPIGVATAAAIQEGYQQRLESLLAVDEAVASIVGTLRATGELDDTLILFTSDNGFFHGEHRVRLGKVLPYEPSIRLPLLMRGPGVPAGERLGQLVTNADLAPTIEDAAGARPGRAQDGRSLLDLVKDPGAQWGRELLLEGGTNQGLTFAGLRNYRWKYIEYATAEKELYDLENDPDELNNLAGDPALAPLRADMAVRLAALRTCAGTAAGRRRRCAWMPRAGAAGSSPPCADLTRRRSSASSSWFAAGRHRASATGPPASTAWPTTAARSSASACARPACCPAAASCCEPRCASTMAAPLRWTRAAASASEARQPMLRLRSPGAPDPKAAVVRPALDMSRSRALDMSRS